MLRAFVCVALVRCCALTQAGGQHIITMLSIIASVSHLPFWLHAQVLATSIVGLWLLLSLFGSSKSKRLVAKAASAQAEAEAKAAEVCHQLQ